jgi:hypothetical protein
MRICQGMAAKQLRRQMASYSLRFSTKTDAH